MQSVIVKISNNSLSYVKKLMRSITFFLKPIFLAILIFQIGYFNLGITAMQEVDPYIKNLLSRFSEAKINGGGRLLYSYKGSNSSFLYDQALAILAFVHSGQKNAAEDILTGLFNLQSPNGTWTFQYESAQGEIYPGDDEISPSGAIAWVAVAIEAYQIKYGSNRKIKFDSMLNKVLDYLVSQQIEVKWKGKSYFPITFSPKRPLSVSFEHNADSYAAFLNALYVDEKKRNEYSVIASNLHSFLETLWDDNRFHVGFKVQKGEPDKDELYLDTQVLGLLALGTSGRKGEDYTSGLHTNCKEFQISYPIMGFVAYRLAGKQPAPTLPVWSEGSLGMMLAMKIAKIDQCEGTKLRDLELAIESITQEDYGVPYSTPSSDPDFTSASSVAGTAWKYFFLKGFNPYHPSEALESV